MCIPCHGHAGGVLAHPELYAEVQVQLKCDSPDTPTPFNHFNTRNLSYKHPVELMDVACITYYAHKAYMQLCHLFDPFVNSKCQSSHEINDNYQMINA